MARGQNEIESNQGREAEQKEEEGERGSHQSKAALACLPAHSEGPVRTQCVCACVCVWVTASLPHFPCSSIILTPRHSGGTIQSQLFALPGFPPAASNQQPAARSAPPLSLTYCCLCSLSKLLSIIRSIYQFDTTFACRYWLFIKNHIQANQHCVPPLDILQTEDADIVNTTYQVCPFQSVSLTLKDFWKMTVMSTEREIAFEATRHGSQNLHLT